MSDDRKTNYEIAERMRQTYNVTGDIWFKRAADVLFSIDSTGTSETDKIRLQNFKYFKDREVVMVIKADYGWEVAHWLGSGGVAPTTDYDTPQEAAARACQMLGLTEPVKPQNWPEVAQIGGDGRSAPPRTPYPNS